MGCGEFTHDDQGVIKDVEGAILAPAGPPRAPRFMNVWCLNWCRDHDKYQGLIS